MDLPSFLRHHEALPTLTQKTEALLGFAETAMQSLPGEVEPLLTEAAEACRREGLERLAALCDRVVGWIEFDRAEYESALTRFSRADGVFRGLGDKGGRIMALNGLAAVHAEQGRFEIALSSYREALRLADETGDARHGVLLRANIGETLTQVGHHAEAEPFLREAALAPDLDPMNRSLVLNQLGAVLLPLGKTDEAESVLRRSETLARQGSFLPALAACLAWLGSIARPDDEAGTEALLTEARDVAVVARDRATLTRATVSLGWHHLRLGAADLAVPLFEEALKEARAIGALPLESQAWEGLARGLKAQGWWQAAYEALERHHDLSGRLQAESVSRELALIRADQTEREAAALVEQTRLLSRLGDLGQRITASLDLETIVVAVYESIGALMKADTLGLGLHDEAAGLIRYPFAVERGQRVPAFAGSVDEVSFSSLCLREVRDLLVNDIEAEWPDLLPRHPPSVGAESWTSRSCLFTPLMAEGRAIGVLSVQCGEAQAYSPRDLAALKTLAASISIAVQNARLFEQVKRLATVDSLTGASTRHHLFERAEQEFQRFRRTQTPLALVMIDLDHFKQLNDGYGHELGDRVLARFGTLCLALKRPHDLFGRYGGEEFALILPETTEEGAFILAERLCGAVRELEVATDRGRRVTVTASFGVTTFSPNDLEIAKVFSRADEALYEAKQGGRDRVVARSA